MSLWVFFNLLKFPFILKSLFNRNLQRKNVQQSQDVQDQQVRQSLSFVSAAAGCAKKAFKALNEIST